MVTPRSWKNADGVAATREFLSLVPPRRAAIRGLMTDLLSPDPFACRCAADLARQPGGPGARRPPASCRVRRGGTTKGAGRPVTLAE